MSLHDHTLRLIHPLLLSSGLLLGVLLASGQAQVTTITPDGTLGTVVTQSGSVHNITGGTRPGNGPNLFHSFDRFSVGTNDTVRFSGPTGIVNILSRVTGGQQSVIDGRLQSTIPGANLYLLNPSGVLFGSNASLDISGSFHVSTADYLRFVDGATFSAHLGEKSTLTVAPPAAFGFLGSTPAPITIQGSALQVSEGKTLSVVGGDIQIVGGALVAPSGRIQLASVASPGEALFSSLELTPDLQVDSFTRLGRLEISQGGLLDVSGDRGGTVLIRSGRLLVDQAQIFANTFGDMNGASLGLDLRITADAVIHDSALFVSPFAAGNGGNIAVHVGRLTLTDGSRILSSSLGAGRGGTLTVTATDAITITGRNSLDNQSGLFSSAFDRGNGGHIFVSAPTLIMDDGQIQAGTLFGSRGNAGGAEVWVGKLTLTGGSQIDTSTFGAGHGGDLRVLATDVITIANEGDIRGGFFSGAFNVGNAGSLFISAPTLSIDNGRGNTASSGRGNAGDLTVEVGTLVLTRGGQIDSSTNGSGQGGKLTVRATDSISISGQHGEFPSGLLSKTGSSGNAGELLSVSAPALSIDGGKIDASTSGDGNAGNLDLQVGRLTLSGGAEISTSTFGAGRGGNLTVKATEVIAIAGGGEELQGGLKSLANASGPAGNIFVSAPTLTITDSGRILARTLADSNAGDIDIRVSRLTLTGGGQIFNGTGDGVGGGNPAGSGQGGNLTVTALDAIFIAGQNSEGVPSGLFSSAQIGKGQGGNISISTPTLTMQDNGGIAATTLDTSSGNGGNIEVQVGRLTLSGGAEISTSTFGSGQGGQVMVTATEAIAITGQGSVEPQTGLFNVTNGSGDAGRLFISAPLLESAGGRILGRTLGVGNGGDIEVRVGRLRLTEGAQIFNGTGRATSGGIIGSDGPGRGGNLTVAATDSIFLAGQDQAGFASGLFSDGQIGRGNAGNLFIATPLLTLDAGGQIAAAVSSSSRGNGGNIEVQVGRLTLTGGAQIDTRTQGSGRGGTVTVAATDQIELHTGGTISSSSSGQGDAGNIVIQAGSLFRSRNGAVTTEAETADGGNITLIAGSRVELRDSQITATVKSGVGKGGNITFDPQFIVLQRSQVRADAFGGPGGNVRLVAAVFLADPASQVSASSALGINGVVDIQAPVTSISGAVAPLPQEFAPIAELLRDRCAERLREGRVSRLVLGGRDGVPSEPGSLLLSPLIQMGSRANGEQAGTPARTGQVQDDAWHMWAGSLEGLDRECARWTGQTGPTVGKKR